MYIGFPSARIRARVATWTFCLTLQCAFNRHHNEARLITVPLHSVPYSTRPRTSNPLRRYVILLNHPAGFRRGDSAWESVQCQRRIWARIHAPTAEYTPPLLGHCGLLGTQSSFRARFAEFLGPPGGHSFPAC